MLGWGELLELRVAAAVSAELGAGVSAFFEAGLVQ